jgi:tRNA-splicing ligase RtcB
MKNCKIYAQNLDEMTLQQFDEAMRLNCNVQGALMPDAHAGYTLPIGAVVKSHKMIFPAYVGYDIGCGMCAVKLDIDKSSIELKQLKEAILQQIPLGANKHSTPREYQLLPSTDQALKIFDAKGRYQLGTLGGGNHFIELGEGNDGKIWVVIHSGSRGFGKLIAEHYMKLATLQSIDSEKLRQEFEAKNKKFQEYNPIKFLEAQDRYVIQKSEKEIKAK